MCLIVVKPKGIELPKETYLRHAAVRNDDGLGIAYVKPNESIVKIKKDFEGINDLVSFIQTNITIEDALIVHFRLATHGLKDHGNRHPFPITKNKALVRKTEVECKLAVAHNGVLTQYSDRDEQLSDSQRFVIEILAEPPIKENLENPGIQMLITEFIKGDRLAILNEKGDLLLFGDFKEEDGLSYSNSGYKPYAVTPYRSAAADYEYGHWGPMYGHEKAVGYEKNWKDHKRREADVTEVPDGQVADNNKPKIFGVCEGCQKQKGLKVFSHGTESFVLCKRCRKKARKGYLDNILIPKSNKKHDESVRDFLEGQQKPAIIEGTTIINWCASCREEFPREDLHLMNGSYLVCTGCQNKMKTDPLQHVLF